MNNGITEVKEGIEGEITPTHDDDALHDDHSLHGTQG